MSAFLANPLAPFQHDFMLDAFFMAALIGSVCAMLSCYLVLKGWSLMGDAISHAVLPGVVLAYIVGAPFAIGAFISGLVCAASTGWIKSNSRVKEDAVMGITFTGLFALGLVLFTGTESDVHLNHILFGHILGIETSEWRQAIITCVITLIVLVVMRKDLLLYCFDINQARAVGLRTQALHYTLLCVLAATIVAALQAVGIILTVAMLITPGCIAYLLTDRFDRMLLIAVIAAVTSSVCGVYISFFLDGATGSCIVLFQSLLFVLAMLFAPKRGLLRRAMPTAADNGAHVLGITANQPETPR